MPGWTVETLPHGFTATHGVVSDATGHTTSDWYTIQGYGHVSGRLDTSSPSFQTDLDSFVDGTLPASVPAATEASLLQMRNRWLAQTDPYLLQPASFPQDMPTDVQTEITGNLAAIEAWRQALRDYPSTVSDWARPPQLPSPPTIELPSGRALIIVT